MGQKMILVCIVNEVGALCSVGSSHFVTREQNTILYAVLYILNQVFRVYVHLGLKHIQTHIYAYAYTIGIRRGSTRKKFDGKEGEFGVM